jgi:hypothetical protein
VGSLENTHFKAVPAKKNIERIFVSRVDPEWDEEEFCRFIQNKTNIECKVFAIKTKFDSYLSFVIEAEEFYSENLLIPELWPKGLIVRKFAGRFNYENE